LYALVLSGSQQSLLASLPTPLQTAEHVSHVIGKCVSQRVSFGTNSEGLNIRPSRVSKLNLKIQPEHTNLRTDRLWH
jgi:hypothetical protein